MWRPEDSDLNRILAAALIGLVLWLLAATVLAQPADRGTAYDPQRALAASRAAIGHTLGERPLVDESGNPFSVAALRGKPLLVSFVYTGCFAACPAATRFLAEAVSQARRSVGPGAFNVLTVGFNQPFDSPAAMRDFRRRHGLDVPNWAFVSADPKTIAALAGDVGFTWSPAGGGFDHVTQLTLIDPQGRVAEQIYGESFELARLVNPLKAMMIGAPLPAGDLSALLDRVRIVCTIYDPRTGSYRLDYALLIEIGAGLSVLLAIAGYLWREWRAQRRVAPHPT